MPQLKWLSIRFSSVKLLRVEMLVFLMTFNLNFLPLNSDILINKNMKDLPFKPLNAEDVYNPKDFVSLELDIYFKNLSSDTTSNAGVLLVETGDKEIILQVPPKSCVTKQSVMIDIFKEKKTKQARIQPVLSFTGKITVSEKMEDDCLRVTVKMVQFEEKEWESFLGLFSKRQDEIDSFFESMKR